MTVLDYIKRQESVLIRHNGLDALNWSFEDVPGGVVVNGQAVYESSYRDFVSLFGLQEGIVDGAHETMFGLKPLYLPFPETWLLFNARGWKKDGTMSDACFPIACRIIDRPEESRYFLASFWVGRHKRTLDTQTSCIKYDSARRWVGCGQFNFTSEIYEGGRAIASIAEGVASTFLYQSQFKQLTRFVQRQKSSGLLDFECWPCVVAQKQGILRRAHLRTYGRKTDGYGGAFMGCERCESGKGHGGWYPCLGTFDIGASISGPDKLLYSRLKAHFKNYILREEAIEQCQMRNLQRLHRLATEHLKTLSFAMRTKSIGVC